MRERPGDRGRFAVKLFHDPVKFGTQQMRLICVLEASSTVGLGSVPIHAGLGADVPAAGGRRAAGGGGDIHTGYS